MPKKKYLVTLADDERQELEYLLHSGTHATRKVTRARNGLGKIKPFFATSSPPPASASGRGPLAAPAAPPARGGGQRKRRAARRGEALRDLGMQVTMGDGRASGVSGHQGLGTAGLKS